MEKSLIYELLNSKYFGEYREELRKEKNTNYCKWVCKSQEELESVLDNDQIKLLEKYNYDVALREEDTDYKVGIKILNYGIKIGMEICKAFFDIDSKE